MAETIRSAERSRVRALLYRDEVALRRIVHPELVYVHSFGRVDRFDRYVADVVSGAILYDEVDHEIEVSKVSDSVALAIGLMSVSGEMGGRTVVFQSRTTSIWVLESDRCRLRSFHSSRIKGAAPGGD